MAADAASASGVFHNPWAKRKAPSALRVSSPRPLAAAAAAAASAPRQPFSFDDSSEYAKAHPCSLERSGYAATHPAPDPKRVRSSDREFDRFFGLVPDDDLPKEENTDMPPAAAASSSSAASSAAAASSPVTKTDAPHHGKREAVTCILLRAWKSKITQEELDGCSLEQLAILYAVHLRKNVFITGEAGTGKSYVVKLLKRVLDEPSTFFTASTGRAAVAIDGTTIHSFGGMKLGTQSQEAIVKSIREPRGHRALGRWQACETLFIDEISMLDGAFFTKLEYVARKIRNNEEYAGGIQLILAGDFLQLPAVKGTQLMYNSPAWDGIEVKILLTTIFRQQGDPVFAAALSRLRTGDITLKDEAMFKKAHYTKLPIVNGIEPTDLHPHKKTAAERNAEQLKALSSRGYIFHARDNSSSTEAMQMLEKSCAAVKTLELKVGAQVILLRNLDVKRGLCNGTRGVVNAFRFDTETQDTLPFVLFENGVCDTIGRERFEHKQGRNVTATRTQIPLTLAWALTIHRAQGMTLDRVIVNSQGCSEDGQLYVAISRVKSSAGLLLKGFRREHHKTDMEVVDWYRALVPTTRQHIEALFAQVSAP